MIKSKFISAAACLGALLLSAGVFTSCDRTDSDGTSISLAREAVTLRSTAGTFALQYEIINPVSDGQLTTEISVDWISRTDESVTYPLGFEYEANPTAEDREGVIRLVYTFGGGSATATVRAIQPAAGSSPGTDNPNGDTPDPVTGNYFKLEVVEVTYTTATCRVTPTNPDMTYMIMVAPREDIEFSSDQEIGTGDLASFENIAAMYNTTAIEYVKQMRLQTGTRDLTVTSLEPREYCLYAYGLDLSDDAYTMTTPVEKIYFTPQSQSAPANGITLTLEETTAGGVSILAVPYDNTLWYACDWNSESILNNMGYTEGTPAERCEAFEREQYLQYYGGSGFFTYENLLYCGTQMVSVDAARLKTEGETYYFFAYFADTTTYECTSDIYILVYTGGQPISSATPLHVGPYTRLTPVKGNNILR